MAEAVIRGAERQIRRDLPEEKCIAQVEFEANSTEADTDVPDDDGVEELVGDSDDEDEDDGQVAPGNSQKPIDKDIKAAVYRLHQNTGHRSRKQLARALAIAGAPAEAIRAAKTLKCSICQEKSRPKGSETFCVAQSARSFRPCTSGSSASGISCW